ncbi:MAG: single-stranded-DNA-specific exonuclease RecJ [Defluviitaleaceae bacterium]|nr:single-stranded-DNA-specific exonuclease RecJ [Defluviitaleaceae bacterium]
MKRWVLRENDANIDLMTKTLGVSPILCEILANRGLRSKNTAVQFLNPLRDYLLALDNMAGVTDAVDIIRDGVDNGKRFCIFGDYDVDGVSGTVILHKGLAGLGADITHYIPHREKEGYGLNMAAVENIAGSGCNIFITVDNGIASVAEVARAIELGMAVIIIDHHEPPFVEEDEKRYEVLPPANAIVNAKQADCGYPFKELSAAGVSYKFVRHLYGRLEKEFNLDNELLIFAAIATFCDVVDLVGENRILAKNGLRLLNKAETGATNIGLNALVKARNLEYNDIDDFAIGFILGPCINASGRLSSADLAVELFLTDDEARAVELASQLVLLNDERKALCAKYVDETIVGLDMTALDDVLVIFVPDIHESIAGIVAGRVKEHTYRPTIVFSDAHGVAKGSARSIEGYNVFEALQKNKDLFTRFGGHAMAAGITMPIENIDELRQRLNSNSGLTTDDFNPIIYGEKELKLDEITFELATQIAALSPFGKANKEPIFFTKGIFTEKAEIVGQSGQTLRLTLRTDNGRKITAIAFKAVDNFVQLLNKNYNEKIAKGFVSGRLVNLNIKLDIAYNIRINTYKGNSSLQLVIIDFT